MSLGVVGENIPSVMKCTFTANMKSYIPLEMAAIFFLQDPFLKQGIG